MIVGRDGELDALAAFVADIGWPAVALIEGEPGIGKSTLWDSAVDAARDRGHTIMSCRPAASDAELAFTGLSDLLDDVSPRAFDPLPPPQRRALDAALLRGPSDAPAPGWRAVSTAMLGLLREVASAGPLLVAIDDLQWLDPSTLRILSFAMRRIGTAEVGLLGAARSTGGVSAARELTSSFPGDLIQHLTVQGLPVDALARILRERAGAGLDRADIRWIHEQTGGNPFYALEFARAVLAKEPRATGRALPVPRSLSDDFVRHRLATLSVDAHESMLAVAATSRPTPRLLREAVEGFDVDAGLDEARRAQVLVIADGVVAFTHPLYGSAIYDDASRSHRHRVHAVLAAHVDDLEERARHLALSRDEPDARVAEELERAASLSIARGAPDAAASLLALSVRSTPPEDIASLVRRWTSEATARFQLGDTDGAIDAASAATRSARAGDERAEALRVLARLHAQTDDLQEARILLDRAIAEPDLGPALGAEIHAELFWILHGLGEFESSRRHAEEALRQPLAADARPVRAIVSMRRVLRLEGVPDVSDSVTDSLSAMQEPTDLPMLEWPALADAEELLYVGRHEEASTRLGDLLATSEARGDESGRARILALLAELERRCGRLASAEAYAEAALELVEQLGYNPAKEVALLGSIHALRGKEEQATSGFARARSLAETASSITRLLGYGHVGAFALSLRHLAEARAALSSATEILFGAGIGEPGAYLMVHDAAETAVLIGELGEAEGLISWLEERGAALDRPYALATGARCRAMLLEAQGDRPAALAHLTGALKEHEHLGMPLELGRTFFITGGVMRRDGQKRAARRSLEAALAIFEDLGAAIWAQRVHDELGHIAGRRPAPGRLTDAEDRVARLARSGLRNQEIADTLVMSVRTVESHLSHVYAKLGIRSRTELAIFYEDPRSELPPP